MIMGGRAGHAEALPSNDAGVAERGREKLEKTNGTEPVEAGIASEPPAGRKPRFHTGTWMWALCGLFVLAAILVTVLSG